jgi:two-component system C4-dicarboxylate transport sensor histidine kinase DctB
MSAGISHELNQPLMAIQQFADNAVKFVEKGRWDVAGSNLGEISKLSHRMARIIKNLRAFARNEAEPVGRVDAVKVITHAIEFQQERLARDDIEVEWAVPRDPIWVRAGEVRLGQVMINLISNAADAMSVCPERRITVAICPVAGAEQTVEIVVDDTGPGIEHPDKIFEPFYTTKEVSPSEGMGLGLSISYGLVQSFGGNIRGTTTSQGARFTIELPVWDEKGD